MEVSAPLAEVGAMAGPCEAGATSVLGAMAAPGSAEGSAVAWLSAATGLSTTRMAPSGIRSLSGRIDHSPWAKAQNDVLALIATVFEL